MKKVITIIFTFVLLTIASISYSEKSLSQVTRGGGDVDNHFYEPTLSGACGVCRQQSNAHNF